MKACPSCGRLYPTDAGFCPIDGSALHPASDVPVPADRSDPRLGSLILERYQLRRIVADGGMGRVYEALDLQEGRNVAVKILHGQVARDPVQVERFKREFAVSRQLPHEHIAEVIDFVRLTDGAFALVMEFLFGEELRQTLERQKMISSGRIVRLISQVANALDEAHSRKLVHRDLKPDNIFLCQTPLGDIVKLLDFGSVKNKALGAKQLTVMGTTIGSPFYMSPEQAQGLETLDHRADVWGVGAILFECLTGQVPFAGANGPQILLSILAKEAPSVSQSVAPGRPVPPGLDAVLEKAFKKTAALRYESVGALADAVGHAYGLQGEHGCWAGVPEAELDSQIAEQLARLMAVPRPLKRKTAQDGFFGEQDALGEADPIAVEPVLDTELSSSGLDPRTRAPRFEELGPEESLAPLPQIPVQTGFPVGAIALLALAGVALLAFFLL